MNRFVRLPTGFSEEKTKDSENRVCIFQPQNDEYTLNIGYVEFSGNYDLDSAIIDASFKDSVLSRVRITANNIITSGFGLKSMNAIIKDNDSKYNGIYIYDNKDNLFFKDYNKECISFYDEDALNFLRNDLRVSEEKILCMEDEDFKRLGLEPDITVEFAQVHNDRYQQLTDMINTNTFEDFKAFMNQYCFEKEKVLTQKKEVPE